MPVRETLPLGAAALLLFVVADARAIGQAGTGSQPPTVAQATARLQAQDPAGAVAILEAVIAREPDNVAAWRTLGAARLQTQAYDGAIVALSRALELQPGALPVMYNLAAAHARKGEADRAMALLTEVRASGKYDMTRIETDVNLTAIRNHAKFRGLMPTDAFYADPFVEPVTIIREWRGEATNDQFGWIARNIGDVDGDGVADVVTSAPTRANGGPRAGRVYVYSTMTGKLLWTADGSPESQLGLGIEAAGDTNADGTPDVIASAPGKGEAYVYSGSDGTVLLTLKGASREENFGRHVSGVGDMNGDGYADVFVGAPGRGASSTDKGRALVYSGRDGAVLLTLAGERGGDGFGSTVAGDAFGTQKIRRRARRDVRVGPRRRRCRRRRRCVRLGLVEQREGRLDWPRVHPLGPRRQAAVHVHGRDRRRRSRYEPGERG